MVCDICKEESKVLIRFDVHECDIALIGARELSLCPDCYCGFADHKYVVGYYPNGFIDLDRYYEETHKEE